MTTSSRRLSARAAVLAACIGLAAVHAPAFADLSIVAESCPKFGRDPSLAKFTHSCGVVGPDDLVSPGWRTLELMAIDASLLGGGVVATLYCMSRASAALAAVARVRSAPSGTGAKRVASVLPAPLDFSRCAYVIRVEVDGTTTAAQALMVALRN